VVDRNQVLERMTVIDGLEALVQSGGAQAEHGIHVVLAGPHPALGGSMDSPLLAEIVWQLGRRHHPTTRFNWRGVGASTGARDEAPSERDLAAVIEHVGEHTALVGVSLGCGPAAALGVADDQVANVVLVSPPLAVARAIDWGALARTGSPVSVIVGSEDAHAPVADLERAIRDGGASFAVRVVAGASHTYLRGLTELGRLVLEGIPAPGAFD
jgi:alpha/beta superfamily hydrolase